MRAYASISPMFWVTHPGRTLRGDPSAQILALYLMTAPAVGMTGIYRMSAETAAFDTGLTVEEVRAAASRVINVTRFDVTENVAWSLPTADLHLGAALKPSDHRVIGVLRELAMFERHPFVEEFVRVNHERYQLGLFPGVVGRRRGWSKVFYASVYARDGSACRYCGSVDLLSVDHVVPRCQGGADDEDNLVVACRACNSRKGGRTPQQAGMVLQ